MKAIYKNHKGLSVFLSSCVAILPFLLFVALTHAATDPKYVPIVGIPGLTNQQIPSLPDYINRVYFLTVTIGALYGVVKIAFAGVKYSMSDIITNKESAKEDIQGVLLGLAILLIPFIVLKEINPNLVKLDVLSSANTWKNKLNDGKSANTVVGSSLSPTAQKSQCDDAGGTWTPEKTVKCDLSMRNVEIPPQFYSMKDRAQAYSELSAKCGNKLRAKSEIQNGVSGVTLWCDK